MRLERADVWPVADGIKWRGSDLKSKKNDEHSVIGSTVDGPRERKVGLEKELGGGGWRPNHMASLDCNILM